MRELTKRNQPSFKELGFNSRKKDPKLQKTA